MTGEEADPAIAARKGGKLKTCLYILTGFVILLKDCAIRTGCPISANFSTVHSIIVQVLSWICVLAAYISFIDYLKNFGSLLKSEILKFPPPINLSSSLVLYVHFFIAFDIFC